MSLGDQFTDYIRACFTGLWIETSEQNEAIQEIQQLCQTQHWDCQVWDIEQGLQPPASDTESLGQGDPLAPLTQVVSAGETPRLILLLNFHRFLASPEIVQCLQRRIIAGRQDRCVWIILSPQAQLPAELAKLFTVIPHELPSREQLAEIARGVATEPGELPQGGEYDQLLEAAAGLTRLEAENAFSLSLVREGRLRSETIWRRKLETLNREGLLTVSRGGGSFENLGGLQALKSFAMRSLMAANHSKLSPKGLLLLGPAGVGKSAWCRALGQETGRPTVILDVGGLMGSLVGQSEANLRKALATIDALGHCVVLLDEVEKALAGTANSGSTDSGVTSRLFGRLLSWMEERQGSYLVASANDISRLPPEFTRAGRFDAVYFLDLPSSSQRQGIWELYRGRYDLDVTEPIPSDEGWTGAEIENCCRLAALLDLPLAEAARHVVPVSSTAAERIAQLQDWASGRCLDAERGGVYRRQSPSASKGNSRRRVARPSQN